MKKMLQEIMQEMKSRFDKVDSKFESIDTKFESIDSKFASLDRSLAWLAHKTDEHSVYLKAILESKEIQKAELDNQKIKMSKMEGVIKAQAGLALKELK